MSREYKYYLPGNFSWGGVILNRFFLDPRKTYKNKATQLIQILADLTHKMVQVNSPKKGPDRWVPKRYLSYQEDPGIGVKF